MKHPVKQVRGKSLWFGPEVEGTLRRVHTAFIRRRLYDADTRRVLERDGLQQIFLTEGFQDWAWLKKSGIWTKLKGRVVFTKACMPSEVAALKKKLKKLVGVRLFVRIEGVWVHKLGPADQISIGTPYHLYAIRHDMMDYTEPGDYELDAP